MKRIVSIFAALLFCASSIWAEVWTIDFNRGTVNGTDIKDGVTSVMNPWLYCTSGGDFVASHGVTTTKCFYDDKGCGIRIGSTSGKSQFVLNIGAESVYVYKIVLYASNNSGNATSTLTINGGSVYVKIISNNELPTYSSSFPASVNYILPEMIVDKSFKNLYFSVPDDGCVMLHRIDIIFSEDNLSLPAQSGGTNYATFSCDTVTFFPNSATVSKVSVFGGKLNVSALDVVDGFGTSGCYVPANTGVLVASTSSSTSYYVLDGETLEGLDKNMLKPASENMEGDYKFYKLAYDDYDSKTGLGFYWGAAGGAAFPCKEGAAYLAVPNNGSSVKGFVLDEASDEDAIKSLTPDFSQGRGEIFYMTGQRISKPLQGIYIKGGRKYVGK